AWRRVQRALQDGYLRNREDRRGRPARLELGDVLPVDAPVLPPARELRGVGGGGILSPRVHQQPCNHRPGEPADQGCTVAGAFEGIENPPPLGTPHARPVGGDRSESDSGEEWL